MEPVKCFIPETLEEALRIRKETGATVLAGGSDLMVANSMGAGVTPAFKGDVLIITNLKELKGIRALPDGSVEIGACTTSAEIARSPSAPELLTDAASRMGAIAKRNSATLGGNLGLRRSDSYLAAALTAADAVLKSITPHGEQDKPVGEYLQSDCKRLIEYVVVDKDRTGSVKRFGNTSSSHATLIAAESGGIYALSVQGSGLIYGTTPDIAEQVTYVDDLTGSAAYKKYLAGIVFTLGR